MLFEIKGENMARILSISSQTVYGPVGNTAAVPALQALGHEVMQVPTALLSNHPGHGKPEGQVTSPALFEAILNRASSLNAFSTCDGILTGYFASAEQVAIAARLIRNIKQLLPKLLVLIDPVIGDHGRLYVSTEIATAIRDDLLPLASITTPNLYELNWLTITSVTEEPDVIAAARTLNINEVLVTSIPKGDAMLSTLLVTQQNTWVSTTTKKQSVPNGTGDFLAGCYFAHRMIENPELSFHHAMQKLEQVINLSHGTPALAVAQALHASTQVT